MVRGFDKAKVTFVVRKIRMVKEKDILPFEIREAVIYTEVYREMLPN